MAATTKKTKMQTQLKAIESIELTNSVFVVAEYRGSKVEEIRWRSKSTGREESMHKYNLSLELADGTQVSGAQMGREFDGAYDLKKGQHYVFVLGRYFVEKGKHEAQVLAVGTLQSLASLSVLRDQASPVEVISPTAPRKAQAS